MQFNIIRNRISIFSKNVAIFLLTKSKKIPKLHTAFVQSQPIFSLIKPLQFREIPIEIRLKFSVCFQELKNNSKKKNLKQHQMQSPKQTYKIKCPLLKLTLNLF